MLRIEVEWLLLKTLWLLLLLLLAGSLSAVLEHRVRQVKVALLIDVVGLRSLANVDVPQAQHLVSLDLDLSFSIFSCDSSPIGGRGRSIVAVVCLARH